MVKIKHEQLKQLIEAAIFASDKPISINRLKQTVLMDFNLSKLSIKHVIDELVLDYQPRGINLLELGSGYRFQTQDNLSEWLGRLWEESAPRYSRAYLETLALIAYRQPITRGEIEQVRGVAVGSNIIKTLTERDWIDVVGHKEVPGRPALYATTKGFLDYFGLASLAQLPAADNFLSALDKAQEPIMLDESSSDPSSTVDTQAADETDLPSTEQIH
ncbi:MAG TPA: SMC-Scp complex subunit ScpB [Glaciecola sp.]|nr:SMC-Scp complex subunit ScpB [Glaciecola sp.]